MKKTIALLTFLSFSISNAQDWKEKRIVGNGNVITITKSTANYDEIHATGAFSVELVSGKEGTIKITGDENIISFLKIDDENGKLRVYLDKSKNYQYHSKLSVTIPFESLKRISFSGSGSMNNEDTIKEDDLEIEVNGSGKASFNLQCNTLEANLAGSGNLNLQGKTNILYFDLTGSGNIEASDLIAQNGRMTLSGSGKIKTNCSEKLEAEVIGSGKIMYQGEPKKVVTNINGSGKIINN